MFPPTESQYADSSSRLVYVLIPSILIVSTAATFNVENSEFCLHGLVASKISRNSPIKFTGISAVNEEMCFDFRHLRV